MDNTFLNYYSFQYEKKKTNNIKLYNWYIPPWIQFIQQRLYEFQHVVCACVWSVCLSVCHCLITRDSAVERKQFTSDRCLILPACLVNTRDVLRVKKDPALT